MVFRRNKEAPSPQTLVTGAALGTTSAPVAAPTAEAPGSGPSEGPLLLLFTVLTLAVSAYVLISAEHDAVHDPKEKAARGEIQGLNAQSLLRAANFRRSLAKVAAGDHPLLVNVRVAADRVNAEVRDNDGNRRILTIDPGFGVNSSDFGVGDDYAVRSSEINAAAPERMVRAVVRKTGLPASAVDYVTMSFSKDAETNTWYMALKQGPARNRQWVAESDGTDLRKPGEPSTAQKRATRAQQLAFARQQARLQRTIELRTSCLRRAGSAEAVSKCLERYQP